MNGISFEDGMKIIEAARQELQSAPAPAAPIVAQHKSVLTDEQAHAFQLMMAITGQTGDTVGRGDSRTLDGIADAIIGGQKAVGYAARAASQLNGLIHGRTPLDVTPKPGTQPFQLPPEDAQPPTPPVNPGGGDIGGIHDH